MHISKIITVICSLLFLMVGADKFGAFLEPPCSLMDSVNPTIWKVLGALQIVSGILIWLPKFKNYIVSFWAVFMLIFTIIHLTQSTYDIGGAASMAAMLGLLAWNPSFIRSKGE